MLQGGSFPGQLPCDIHVIDCVGTLILVYLDDSVINLILLYLASHAVQYVDDHVVKQCLLLHGSDLYIYTVDSFCVVRCLGIAVKIQIGSYDAVDEILGQLAVAVLVVVRCALSLEESQELIEVRLQCADVAM